MTTCITTFSEDGYHLYGKKMISSWIRYWPNNFNLTIYHENYHIQEHDHRLKLLDLENCCPNLKTFKENSNKLFSDAETKKQKNRVLKTVKWCHKVYAITHALQNIEDDYIIFLDGDTYTVDNVDANLAEKLVENYLFSVHFERLKNGLHFETGLVTFNMSHDKIAWLAENLTTAYDSLEIYNMEKTWDGYWLAYLYQKYNLPIKNLALNSSGVFSNPLIAKILKHDVGVAKYKNAGYNEFSGRK